MTPRWQLWLMFGLPPVVMLLFLLLICAVEGNFAFFIQMAPFGALTFVLIYGFAWLLLRGLTSGTYGAFETLSRKRQGSVRNNALGEQQLRLPHAESTIAVDLRTSADSYHQARSGGGV